MNIWKIILLTLKEYHKRRYLYYLLVLCIAPTIALDSILEVLHEGFVNAVLDGIAFGIVSFCAFAMILLGMQTYSSKIDSGSIVLDITKPLNRKEYFIGKVISNIIVLFICIAGILLSSALLLHIHGYHIPSEIFSRASGIVTLTPLFILSVVSLINLYLSTKATGISAFIIYIIYFKIQDHLMNIQYDPKFTVMGRSFSGISLAIEVITILLITIGTLLFNRKEL